jgi:hypothetical protein
LAHCIAVKAAVKNEVTDSGERMKGATHTNTRNLAGANVCINNPTMVTRPVEQWQKYQSNVGFGWQWQQNDSEDVSAMRAIDAYAKCRQRCQRNKGKDATAIRATMAAQQQWRHQHGKGNDAANASRTKTTAQQEQRHQHKDGKDASAMRAKTPAKQYTSEVEWHRISPNLLWGVTSISGIFELPDISPSYHMGPLPTPSLSTTSSSSKGPREVITDKEAGQLGLGIGVLS